MSVHRTIDKVGIALSSACAVHCAAAPILITLAPLVGLGAIVDHKYESVLILITFGLASLSVGWGFVKTHRQFLPLGILLLGIALISLAELSLIDFPSPALMALGGLSIAVSHFINARLCKTCHDCDHQH